MVPLRSVFTVPHTVETPCEIVDFFSPFLSLDSNRILYQVFRLSVKVFVNSKHAPNAVTHPTTFTHISLCVCVCLALVYAIVLGFVAKF